MSKKGFLNPDKDAPATLSREIVRRFLSEEQYKSFVAEYNASSIRKGAGTRFDTLAKPITQEEWEIAKWYLNDKNVSIANKARQIGIKDTTFYNQIQPIIVRIAYQNKEKLGL